jgi:hypothetical protein
VPRLPKLQEQGETLMTKQQAKVLACLVAMAECADDSMRWGAHDLRVIKAARDILGDAAPRSFLKRPLPADAGGIVSPPPSGYR